MTVKVSAADAPAAARRWPASRSAWVSRSAWGYRRAPAHPGVEVSDEQIAALVCAASRLGRRRRSTSTALSPAAAERLLRLDWAVRAGQRALADRAARARAAAGPGPRLRGRL